MTDRAVAEIASFLHSALDLVAAGRRVDPAVAAVLDAGSSVRVSIDLGERVAVVSAVDRHGRAHAVLAAIADPHSESFGLLAPPEPVRGLFDDAPEALPH